jgi:hypothetical protein
MKNDAVGSDDEEGILVLALGLSLSHQGLGLGPPLLVHERISPSSRTNVLLKINRSLQPNLVRRLTPLLRMQEESNVGSTRHDVHMMIKEATDCSYCSSQSPHLSRKIFPCVLIINYH